MTDGWITADWIFDGQSVQTGVALRVAQGRVIDIGPAPGHAPHWAGGLTPGFVDLQVNGGGGVLVNATPTAEGFAQIAAAHRRFGTVAILPTVITDRPEVLEQAVTAAIAARGVSGVIGLHIEGPHIAPARRGTHAGKFVRPFDARTFDQVARLRGAGVPVMITVAPEACDLDQISALSGLGAVVSLGHTDATEAQVTAALQAGASCGTHLFNAMSAMTARAPGTVGGLINSKAYVGIICDGYHVADSMVGLAVRARPIEDRMFLVSDSMPTVGGPDTFDLYGRPVHLKEGRLLNAEGGLAGAHVTQAEGLARLVRTVGIPLQAALRMAISTPAACMGCADLGTLIGRSVTDVLCLDADLRVQGTLDQHRVAERTDAAE